MPGLYTARKESFFFYDVAGNGNPVSPYQIVSLASSTEIDAAKAAGWVPSGVGVGDVVIATPLSSGVPTRRIIGVTDSAALSIGVSGTSHASGPKADALSVIVDGVAHVMFGASTSFSVTGLVTCTLSETRLNTQTPFVNNNEMLLPMDPRIAVTYRLAMAGALTITPAGVAGNAAANWPLGYLLDEATAKYDILPVELARSVIYA